MKILVLGDPHGTIPTIKTDEFDAIICTGDFVPDEQLRKIIFSSMRLGIDWQKSIPKRRLEQVLFEHKTAGWRVLTWLAKQHKPVYLIPGNWDMMILGDKPFYGKRLTGTNLVDCDGCLVQNKTFSIIGYGQTYGPELHETRNGKKPIKDKKYLLKLKQYDKLFARAKKSGKSTILLTHNPPFDTTLDKIRNKDSPANGKHIGSQLIRELILKHKPAICICGHMHENDGHVKLGKTDCINVGCLRAGYYYILDLKSESK